MPEWFQIYCFLYKNRCNLIFSQKTRKQQYHEQRYLQTQLRLFGKNRNFALLSAFNLFHNFRPFYDFLMNGYHRCWLQRQIIAARQDYTMLPVLKWLMAQLIRLHHLSLRILSNFIFSTWMRKLVSNFDNALLRAASLQSTLSVSMWPFETSTSSSKSMNSSTVFFFSYVRFFPFNFADNTFFDLDTFIILARFYD